MCEKILLFLIRNLWKWKKKINKITENCVEWKIYQNIIHNYGIFTINQPSTQTVDGKIFMIFRRQRRQLDTNGESGGAKR
jgi:hypothetical protein